MKQKQTINFLLSSAVIVALLFGSFSVIPKAYAQATSSAPATPSTEEVNNALADLSVPFIQNQGQVGNTEDVSYYTQTIAGNVFIGPDGLTYALPKSAIKEHFISDHQLVPQGQDQAVTSVNYFKGTQDQWKSNLPSYNTVSGGEVWQGIDVSFKASHKNIEKIFTVAPDSNPKDIQMSIEGATISLLSEGQLILHTESGDIAMTKPVAYQNIDGQNHDVAVEYNITSNDTYGFILGSYNHSYPLIIDPLIASTFVGGTGFESGTAVALDSSGNVYVAGTATDATAPVTAGAYDEVIGGAQDIYVVKLNATLTSLLAATFIGGSSAADSAASIAIDSSDNVYITGAAGTGFPTTVGAYDETYNDTAASDAFVSKFNSSLTSLLASTYIGSPTTEQSFAITVDSLNDVIIVGRTANAAYPATVGAYDESYNGNGSDFDAFVSKFNPSLTTLIGSSFIGTSGADLGLAVIADSSGNIFVSGSAATGFPVTAGAYDETQNGSTDGYIAKFNSTLTTLSASTFIGGTAADSVRALAFDSSGNVYASGTANAGFPVTAGAYDETQNGSNDGFVAKLNSSLTTLYASTFIGGAGSDQSSVIVLDDLDNVYVAGFGASGFPVTAGAYDETQNGSTDGYIAKFNPTLTTLSASTFIGGTGVDTISPSGMAIDSSSQLYITGQSSSGFPSTVGVYDETLGGTSDVFVSKFTSNLLLLPTLEFASTSSSASEDAGTVNLSVSMDAAGPSDASIDYAVTGGTAVGSGSDYILASGTLTIPTGSTSGNISMFIVDDDRFETKTRETVVVTLSNPVNSYLGTETTHTFSIDENDKPLVGGSFSQKSPSAIPISPTPFPAEGCSFGNLFSPTTGQSCGQGVTPTTTPTADPVNLNYDFGTTTVKKGNTGLACRAWQSFFNSKFNSHLVVDGKCGPLTMAVAKAWQASVGLVADGLLGPLSRGKAAE